MISYNYTQVTREHYQYLFNYLQNLREYNKWNKSKCLPVTKRNIESDIMSIENRLSRMKIEFDYNSFYDTNYLLI